MLTPQEAERQGFALGIVFCVSVGLVIGFVIVLVRYLPSH